MIGDGRGLASSGGDGRWGQRIGTEDVDSDELQSDRDASPSEEVVGGEDVDEADAADAGAASPEATGGFDQDAGDRSPDLDAASGGPVDAPDGERDEAWTAAHGVEPIDEERAFAAGMTADDLVDFADRHYRPSRWGRVDLSLSWERAVVIRGAPEPASYRVDEVWLRAAWRL